MLSKELHVWVSDISTLRNIFLSKKAPVLQNSFHGGVSYRLKLRSDEKRWGGLHDQPRVYYGGKLSLIFFPTLAERLIRILRRKQDQLKSLQKVLQSKNDKNNLQAILAATLAASACLY